MHVCDFAFYLLFFSIIQKGNSEREEDKSLHHLLKRKTQNLQRPLFVRDNEGQSALGEIDTSDIRNSDARYRRKDDLTSVRQRERNYERRPHRQAIESELDLKRNQLSSRKEPIHKRDVFEPNMKMRSSYGIVYGNGRPVGILEPYPQTYELSSLDNANSKEVENDLQPPSKSRPQIVDILYPLSNQAPNSQLDEDGERDESDIFETAKYNDDKYPSVLANFKIDSKLKMNDKMRGDQPAKRTVPLTNEFTKYLVNKNVLDKNDLFKRAAVKTSNLANSKRLTDITQDKIDELKIQLDRLQNPSAADNLVEIEQNLKNVLEDMGLIDDKTLKDNNLESEMQDAKVSGETGEDENMEEGINKIELTRENHEFDANERNKRENLDSASDKTKEVKLPDSQIAEDSIAQDNLNAKTEPKEKDENAPLRVTDDSRLVNNAEDQLKTDLKDSSHFKKRESKLNIANYQTEGEDFIRKKRQEKNKKSTENSDNLDIMKGLEKSGDLTVSGNKSPLASKNDNTEADTKRKAGSTSTCPPTNVAVSGEDVDYEKRIERDLQAKIDAIKEQVKREIDSIKNPEPPVKSLTKATQRKKRETVNTLLDEESSNLDPGVNTDEALKPLIRRRRSDKALNRSKRETDVSTIQSIESGDYLSLNTQDNNNSENDYSDESNDHQQNLDVLARLTEAKAIEENDDFHNQDDLSKNSIEASRNVANAAPKEDTGTPNIAKFESKESPDPSKDIDRKPTATLEQKRNANDISEKPEKEKQKEDEDLNGPPKLEKRSPNAESTQKKVIGSFNNENDGNKKKRNANEMAYMANRKRRQVDNNNQASQADMLYCNTRRKRANAIIPEANAAYLKFRDEDEEMDNEGDEFDDDGFDDRTTNLLRKRQANYAPQMYYGNQKQSIDYQSANNDDFESQQDQGYQNFDDQNNEKAYGNNLNSDNYEKPSNNYGNYLYADVPGRFVRRKRQDQLVALHGGGPMLNHLANIRERSQFSADSARKKRKFKRLTPGGKEDESVQLSELSDTDLFGGLPQSYEGELSRFKRVKRSPKQTKYK